MIEEKDFYGHGLALHGHKCPAMPMGLRVGAAALNALGVERAADGQLLALVELGEEHCATCFADGVQTITGCLRQRQHQEAELRQMGPDPGGSRQRAGGAGHPARRGHARQQADVLFQGYREKGVPASQDPPEVVQPLVDRVMGAPAEQLLTVGPVFSHPVERHPHSFAGLVCAECGEMVVEGYTRLAGERKVCIPCREKLSGLREPAR